MSVTGDAAIGVLGPLRLCHDGTSVSLPAARPQTLLQLLVLRADRWWDVDELVDTLWEGRPPVSAPVNLRGFVCQWRKLLDPLGAVASIESRRGGYRITMRPSGLDAHVFEALVSTGDRALNADPAAAVRTYESALRLWRGTPFESVGTAALPDRVRLTELRDGARSGLVTGLLATGRLVEAITVLRRAVRAQPYDEKVWARLIVTLTAVGRPAAAQDAYRRVRTLLRRELGVTPGDELRRAAGSVAAGGDHGPGPYLIRGAAG